MTNFVSYNIDVSVHLRFPPLSGSNSRKREKVCDFSKKKFFRFSIEFFSETKLKFKKSSGHFYAPICILSIYVKTFAFRITHEAKDSFESGCKIDF